LFSLVIMHADIDNKNNKYKNNNKITGLSTSNAVIFVDTVQNIMQHYCTGYCYIFSCLLLVPIYSIYLMLLFTNLLNF